MERIEKESGLKIREGDKAVENARFRTLFNNKEFLVFIDRRKFADKRLAEVRPARIVFLFLLRRSRATSLEHVPVPVSVQPSSLRLTPVTRLLT